MICLEASGFWKKNLTPQCAQEAIRNDWLCGIKYPRSIGLAGGI
jgi:hypothetical protein